MVFRVREVREAKGVTQVALSEKTGISRAALWALETGKSKAASTNTLEKIANALNVHVADLFLADDAQPTKND